jgi:hypothetical protein
LETAPPSVRAADAGRSGLRLPVFNGPPLARNRRRLALRVLVAASVIVVVSLGALGVEAVAHRSHAPGRNDRVRALTKVAVANALAVTPSTGQASDLVNSSDHLVLWRTASPVDWLLVVPASGRLAPGQTAHITTTVLPTAPEGPQAVTLTITGDDGSAAALRVEATVNHPPQVGATLDGCTVTATAEDEDGIASVKLHWSDASGEQAIDLLKGDTGYSAALPQRPTALTWWVVAGDTKGNEARTANQVATACQ